MKINHIILLALVMCAIMAPLTSAINVSFASIDGATERDVYLYSHNGTLLGLYNTTSTGIPLPTNSDATFMFKPQTSSAIDDPQAWFTNYAFPWVKTNLIGLMCLAALIGLALAGRR